MIILRSKTGEIAVMTVVSDKEDAIRKFQEQHPEFIDYYDYEGQLPSDRKFRDAWEFKDNKIVVNDKKALSIHMERVREARDQALIELDKEQLKHLIDNWKLQEIEQKKQLLRDLPSNVTTLDWPDNLARI